ncbi:MAG: hypothetical protein V1904_14670 [Bacteroidota bacterium]
MLKSQAMNEDNFQKQINDINIKLDTLLEYVNQQRIKNEMMEDLISDGSIVVRAVFKSSVEELDKSGVEMNTEEVKILLVKLVKNIPAFVNLIDIMQSLLDFMNDAAPIAREMIVDGIKKLHLLEENGTIDSLKRISANISQPAIFKKIEKVTDALLKVEPDEVKDDKSLWKLYKDLRSPEVRKSLSYTMRLIKEINN